MADLDKDKAKVARAVSADNDVIHVLRSTHSNQAGLISLADQKANVIIGIVAVTITLLFTNTTFLKNLSQPLITLLFFSVLAELLALFFALLVMMPKSAKKIRRGHLDTIENPLFFGHFTQHKENEYVNYMIENIDNNLAARQHMVRDIYQTGLVLRRKYKYLKYAYALAASGIVTFVILGVISMSG